MNYPLRAIYRGGHLELLDPVELTENEVIQFVILSEKERAQIALADLLVEPDKDLDEIDEPALMREIENAFRGQTPLSETILQERHESP